MSASFSRKDLEALPIKGTALYAGDERMTPYLGDVVRTGHPDLVVRARDQQEIAEVLAACHRKKIPVTFAGGLTGLTGAATADNGVVIITEQLNRIQEIGRDKDGQAYVISEPGIFLGELKAAVSAQGYFYPPDPTSYKEAALGGTVATNATGEDTLYYGPTRKFVRAMTVILADGTLRCLARPKEDRPPETKGSAGYDRTDPFIDLFIGSEGTLGYIADVTLSLISDAPDWWAAIGFFESLDAAAAFARQSLQSSQITPRALEFMDAASLKILRAEAEVPPIPEDAAAAVYWKQEFRTAADLEGLIGHWLDLMLAVEKEHHTGSFVEQTWFARSEKEKNQFREWRHLIPSAINEEVNQYRGAGGGKVASDWWVPIDRFAEAMREVHRESAEAGLAPIAFGHIGNGHPHVNYLARNAEEYQKGMELIRRQCVRAVQWQGGVAGEHGLGKIFRNLLGVQHSQEKIAAMMKIKRAWDPHWILGQGTLFPVPSE